MDKANKRTWLLGVFLVGVALTFWLGSRYPSLNLKAEAGPSMVLDGLGFDSVMPVEATDSTLVLIGKRTVNWLKTNLRGMLFGLVLAGGLSTWLSLLERPRTKSRFWGLLLGMGIGAPMGLCVNCAAPIAAGLNRSGARMETSLAAMLSSPTLNVIVLSFMVTMLPWHLSLVKILTTLFVLFVLVPWTCRRWPVPDKEIDQPDSCPSPPSSSDESWGRACKEVTRALLRSLFSLTLRLAPSMVLAGFLGSLLVTVLPFDFLQTVMKPSLWILFLIAFVGTFLPVPIAFDVILCTLLYNSGVSIELVTTLLVTLGSYSVYSFMVVRQNLSKQHAGVLFLSTMLLGLLGGQAAGWLDRSYRESVDQELFLALNENVDTGAQPSDQPLVSPGVPETQLRSQLEAQALGWNSAYQDGQHHVSSRAFLSRSPTSETLFTSHSGSEFGLESPVVLSYREHLTIPTLSNRSISSGDIQADGWTDLVLANDFEVGGLSLFTNVKGRFVKTELSLGEFDQTFITVCALVDLNSDGWLDLYFSTLTGENRVLLNQAGQFTESRILPSLPKVFVNAVAFSDIDQDGSLDIVMGGWVHRGLRKRTHLTWNYVAFQNSDLSFELRPLPGLGGNCHSILVSDINTDGHPDIVVGNDFRLPDEFYEGNGTRSPVQVGTEKIPLSTEWTMSLDSADLNNDGRLEVFAAHIAFPNDSRTRRKKSKAQDPSTLLRPLELEPYHYMTQTDDIHDRVRFGASTEVCLHSGVLSSEDRYNCLYDSLLSRPWRSTSREDWKGLLPPRDPYLHSLFDRVFLESAPPPPRAETPEVTQIPSSKRANVLLQHREGRFQDRAEAWGLSYTDWTWNAKFADLDLDGWQDLFLVNGSFQEKLLSPNQLYLNQQGQELKRVNEGTEDYFPTSNYTYIDWDNDGDLDIITSPPNGALRCLQNNQQEHQVIGLILEDKLGLRSAIGSTVVLETAQGPQRKELKASGGFGSFDAPVLWFGLKHDKVTTKLKIRWPNGDWTTLQKPLEPGRVYKIVRRAKLSNF